MAEHHPYGPSVRNRRDQCPASRLWESDLPDTAGDAAAEGVRLHELTAQRLASPAAAIPDEDCWLIDRCAQTLCDACNRHLSVVPDLATAYTEDRLWLRDEDATALCYGTADVVVLDHTLKTALVVDWKFGHGELDPDAIGSQLEAYMAMAIQQYEMLRAIGIVYAPRHDETHAGSIEASDVPSIIDNQRRIIATAEAASRDDVRPGTHCQYCRALGVCPATQDQLRAVATITATEDAIAAWPRARLAEAMPLVAQAQKIIDAVRSATRSALEADPTPIAGYRLETTHGARSADAVELWARLSGAITREDFLGCCTPRVAQLESVVGRDTYNTRAGDVTHCPTIQRMVRRATK